jgi:hypothetical protein
MSRSERDTPEWDEFDRALLSSAALDAPEQGALARATRALGAATLASAALVSAGTSLGASSSAASGSTLVGVSLSALGKALLVGAAVGVGFVGVVNRARAPEPDFRRVAPPVHVVSAPRVVQPAPARAQSLLPISEPDSSEVKPAALEPRAREQMKTLARARAPVALAPTTRPAALPATSLAVEVELLDRARAALSRKDASLALRELDRYAQQAGERSLAREASLLRIEALRALGDATSAAEIAKRLVADDPGGLTGQRARELMR